MKNIILIVHGGAGQDSQYIRKHTEEYKKGLQEAVSCGYNILLNGGSAIDAVEKSVNKLEENPLFNAGRGSALNEKAEVEMDASIMDGRNMKSGAVCLVKNVKYPVSLARLVMEKSKHSYLGGEGAVKFAIENDLKMMPDAYFVTEHAYQQYMDAKKEEGQSLELDMKPKKVESYGTVGAVALDLNGNLASATSTGGTENKSLGRIGDSSIIGIGTYADNDTCAISCTGDGEYIMEHNVAFHVSALIKYKGLSLIEACQYLMKQELKNTSGDIGLIAVDTKGNFVTEFNSQRMHRAWKTGSGDEGVMIYKE
jgi:beta-aspartyl-peptidase (threonine type)